MGVTDPEGRSPQKLGAPVTHVLNTVCMFPAPEYNINQFHAFIIALNASVNCFIAKIITLKIYQ